MQENKKPVETGDQNDQKIREIGTYLIHKHIEALKELAKGEP